MWLPVFFVIEIKWGIGVNRINTTCVNALTGMARFASIPMLPPVASVPSPPTHQPAPLHVGDEMAHGPTGGWLLAAETISAGQTTRPSEIIIDITSEEIKGHTSLSTALVVFRIQ